MVTIEQLDETEQWNEYVDRADGGTIFHRGEFLAAAAETTGADLTLLVGKKGDHPVGIFPLFTTRKGPFTIVFSPPPGTGIRYLGPLYIQDPNIKYRKGTKTKHRFVDDCLEWLSETIGPRYVRITCSPASTDVRPFSWDGFDSTPKFTHQLDLEPDEDALLSSFSRDARRSITKTDPDAYTITDGGKDGLQFIVQRLQERYEEQGMTFDLSEAYTSRIYETLPEEYINIYCIEVDGTRVSGQIALQYDDTVWLWQGTPKPPRNIDVPTNDLLVWHTLCQAREEGCTVADLAGANTERLWKYMAQFNPHLTEYYTVTRADPVTAVASSLYQKYVYS